MQPSRLVVKSRTHHSWSGNIVNRKPPREGGFLSINSKPLLPTVHIPPLFYASPPCCTHVLHLRRITSPLYTSPSYRHSLHISSLLYASPPSSTHFLPLLGISFLQTHSPHLLPTLRNSSQLYASPSYRHTPHISWLLNTSPPSSTHLLPLLRMSSPSSSQRPTLCICSALYASPRNLTHLLPYCLNPHRTRFRFELCVVGRKTPGLRHVNEPCNIYEWAM